MDNTEIQKKCTAFLQELGVPGFIVFGWQKTKVEFGFVYSRHNMPADVAIRGMAWAIQDLSGKH